MAGTTEPGPERAGARRAGASKPKRASKAAVRVWAWTLGALSFFSPFALFGLWPRAAQSATVSGSPSGTTAPHRPVVVIVTRKIIYTQAAAPSVSSSGPVHYVYSAAPAPVAASCGTHPC